MKVFSSGACAPIHMLLPLLAPAVAFLAMMAMAVLLGGTVLQP